jgi:hypothetical protein
MHHNKFAADMSLVAVTWYCHGTCKQWLGKRQGLEHQHKCSPNMLHDFSIEVLFLLTSEVARVNKAPQQVQQQQQQAYLAGLLLSCVCDQANVVWFTCSARCTIAATQHWEPLPSKQAHTYT